jgi:hypothetical protein
MSDEATVGISAHRAGHGFGFAHFLSEAIFELGQF